MENNYQKSLPALNAYFNLAKKAGLVKNKTEFSEFIGAKRYDVIMALNGHNEFIDDTLLDKAKIRLSIFGLVSIEPNGVVLVGSTPNTQQKNAIELYKIDKQIEYHKTQIKVLKATRKIYKNY